jgi:hypothetical protein
LRNCIEHKTAACADRINCGFAEGGSAPSLPILQKACGGSIGVIVIPDRGLVYRPRFLGHRIETYAALAAG